MNHGKPETMTDWVDRDIVDRSLRVAMTGVVHDDDPTIIADMMTRIETLQEALGNLVSALGAPDCGEISEAAEAACNRAIDVLAETV